jgi:response regulator of citrate/malate metabolism
LRDRFHLTVTNSVERAKSVLQRDRFAFAVFDFFLVDGVSAEIIRHLEEHGMTVPVIITSAEDDGRLLANLGPSDLIEGVFSKSDIDQVCRVLRQAQIGSPA